MNLNKIDTLKRKMNKKISPLLSPFYIDYMPDYKRSIFLAGTERSGTTWISEVINYKNDYRYIFEPFWPVKVDVCKDFKAQQYLRPENREPYFLEAAETILAGKIRNKWTDRYHRRFIANKRLIKDVRANLFLKWLHDNFPEMPIIFLFRHPCATVSSQIKRNHQFGSVQKEFFAQEDLVTDFLAPFQKDYETLKTDFEQRVFRWCIQNYVPLQQFKPGEIHLAFYENFCEKPDYEIERMFSFMKVSYDETIFAKLRKPSPQSGKHSAIVSGNSLVSGWKKNVTDEQVQRTVEILAWFGLDKIYSHDSMPNEDAAYQMLAGDLLVR